MSIHIDIPFDSSEYPFSRNKKNRQRFQSSWYKMFNWLAYSFAKNDAYCLLYYLFVEKVTGRFGAHAFTIGRFHN